MDKKRLLHFSIDERRVDMTRCQISTADKIIQLEPKVMDVLHYLACHQGQVLSQEQIFSAIWPNSVFTPGSLQRCIRLLRVAFGEDAHNAKIIITHPKRGYCLEAAVTQVQQDNTEAVNNDSNQAEQKAQKRSSSINLNMRHFGWAFSVLFVFLLFLYGSKGEPETDSFPDIKTGFSTIRPITATSDYEFFSSYSHDGRHLAFIRAGLAGQQHIWLKELDTGIETRLTSLADNYFALAWHPNGTELIYAIGRQHGDEVGSLTVDKPDKNRRALNVESGFISNLQWPVEDKFYYLCQSPAKALSGCRGLYRYDWDTQSSTPIYQTSSERSIEQMAISHDGEYAMLVSRVDQALQVSRLNLHSFESQLVKEYGTGTLEVSWHPSNKAVLVNYNNRLELLSIHGARKVIEFNNYLNLLYPSLDPGGQEITLTLSKIDQDLKTFDVTKRTPRIAIDSTGRDVLARFGHSKHKLAYISSRAGAPEVFVKTEGGERRLFSNPNRFEIQAAPAWSSNGNALAFAVNNHIYIHNLQTDKGETIETDKNLYAVLDWFAEDKALLLGYNDNQRLTIRKRDLENGREMTLATGVLDARLDKNERLILQYDDELVMVSENTRRVLPTVEGNVIRIVPDSSGILYQVNRGEHAQLWRLVEQDSQFVADLPAELYRLQDAFKGQFLFITDERYDSEIVILK